MRSWVVLGQRLVFESLVTIGARGEIVPALAARAEPSGANELRIWLRSGARFSDGSPVTFADVARSLAGGRLRVTEEGSSILITSEEVGLPIELLVSRALVFRRTGERELGTQVFRVEEEDPAHVLLTRLQHAPGLIDRVRLDSYPTPQDTFARTLKGDAEMLPEVQPRWVELFEGVPRLRILRAPSNYANMVALNPARLSRSERISLARVLAADEIRSVAFGDDCAAPAHRPEIEPLPRGRPLEVLTLPFFDRFGFAVRRALGDRGGAVRTLEAQEFVAALRSGDFDLATIRPQVWPPIMAAMNWHTATVANVFGYSNATVDAALDRRDWAAGQRALDDDPPAAFVCTPPSVVVLDSRVKAPPLGEGAFLHSLPQWEVAQ
jgi:hypothetical protein